MKWYEKFKVGQKVKVVRKIVEWTFPNGSGCSWFSEDMDGTIGKLYKIIEVSKNIGYRLHIQIPFNGVGESYDYWYPVESLAGIKGEQLTFAFMQTSD